MDDVYLTLSEAGRRAHCKPCRLKRLAEQGKLPGAVWVTVLGRWAIPERALRYIVAWPPKVMSVGGITHYPIAAYAKRKGVTRQRVHQWIEAGKIQAKQLDGMWFVSETYL